MNPALLSVSLLALFAALPAFAASSKLSVESGVDYNTGDYGKTQSTDILYVPVTVRYQTGAWSMKVTVPYLKITSPGSVIGGVGPVPTITTPRTTQSGLGDVVLAANKNVYNDSASGFMLNLGGKVKLGTADSAKNLGSGKNDYAVQADVYQTTGRLTGFGTAGYRKYGSPATYTLNNVYYGLLGGSYKFDKATGGGAMFNYSQKVSASSSPHREAIFFVSRKLENNWKAQGYVLKGFTSSVPDWGFGLTLNRQL